MTLPINKIICGDCLVEMKNIPDNSIDMILADLPYGMTACQWDTIIPFEPLWEQYKRIIKSSGAIVLTASQPFTSALVMSNLKMFKYEWIWQKTSGSNFATVKYQPFKEHENILIFSKGKTKYNPQMQKRNGSGQKRSEYTYKSNTISGATCGNIKTNRNDKKYIENERYPSSVQLFNNREKGRGLHPTQKPVALGQYLIKTYTNEGDLVLDNTCGSGSFLVSAKLEKRNFIGIDISKEYCKLAKQRLKELPETLF